MNERLCNLFEACESPEAPLCPIQERTVKRGIWYPDEPICQAEQFQGLSWIKKQNQIAAFRLKIDVGYFTVRMLDVIHVITKNIMGADPDYLDGEAKWFEQRDGRKPKVSIEKRKKGKAAASKNQVTIPLFDSSELDCYVHNHEKGNGNDKKDTIKTKTRSQDGIKRKTISAKKLKARKKK
jgi:hypothetical protein